ncbi:pyruvate formate lyase activating enzyme [Sporobacter termitidis DSM 10068]|uniref:Pyruvate formate lyase activating enzyme n=1 Tax=Sporobacter termitidis DSM 10068 TaxID=1123282 RepID=A0A1M5ZBU2_9FIRM|nr:glycyl-radical enzyme activating protein [Sporobacter termitidis]SHI21684.1 pyruvate formate lyase activating enzyme [Sporobacter termitidis DSM 10068]
MENNTGIVFNIQRYSIDDGPGVRTTVFLKGCPLSCLWCSNPESQRGLPEITYRYTSCKRCGTCVQVCPAGAVTLDGGGVHIDRDACTLCEECVHHCVPEALKVSGKKMTVDEVFKVVKRDADYYEASGGGVTASGGEILAQADFVAALFRRCREAGYHTNADTCGFGDPAALCKILEYSDLVFFDLKHLDPAKHREYCGQSNELILDNLARVVKKGVPMVIRVPLIPGYNNSEDNLRALAETVKAAAGDAPVNLLPYHRYGANKYRMVDMTYRLEDVPELTQEELNKAKAIIDSYGLACEISK